MGGISGKRKEEERESRHGGTPGDAEQAGCAGGEVTRGMW